MVTRDSVKYFSYSLNFLGEIDGEPSDLSSKYMKFYVMSINTQVSICSYCGRI